MTHSACFDACMLFSECGPPVSRTKLTDGREVRTPLSPLSRPSLRLAVHLRASDAFYSGSLSPFSTIVTTSKMSSPAAAPATVFARYPAALALPTADPNALAVETMLRCAEVRYTRADARLGDLSLTISPAASFSSAAAATSSTSAAKAKSEVCAGLMSCLRRLGGESAFDAVPSTHAATAVCVEVLTVQCLFPAFLFYTHFDPALYKAAMRRSVEPKVATFWEWMRGTYRAHILRENPFFYSGTAAAEVPRGKLSLTSLAKLKEVGEGVDKAFAVLESLRKTATSAGIEAGNVFFLGTSRPTYIDALVYAAASSFVHADLREAAAGVKGHQRRVQDACPALLEYVEGMRRQFFEADSGTYCLKPCEAAADVDPHGAMAHEAERQYRSGRLPTLWWTGLFASVYFLLVNADMLVALLEQAEEESEEVAAVEAAAGAAGGTASQQSSPSSASV
ncbi:conserved hypothetical protein [Leishmania infantum JPCM5]|uniref:Metaxin glutathione S-transferase domain-containing protein n=1 Tax=Leishmania infantum TaxID=5671 RepID=A4HZF6_LEIIN|nr:conserved hypothetical protein [Leishmania infantum JPCM5]CAM67868.1 conserved hypothetical protein [Leishmania infantum JPCM5]|eukprot:XP_001465447.1 conserved hypothetical protein [Leishmania infantum JPCM5]